jgi:hypothetical protein
MKMAIDDSDFLAWQRGVGELHDDSEILAAAEPRSQARPA